MFVRVVGSWCGKFEIGQTFSLVQTEATLLGNNSQQCWELLRSFVRSLKGRDCEETKGVSSDEKL